MLIVGRQRVRVVGIAVAVGAIFTLSACGSTSASPGTSHAGHSPRVSSAQLASLTTRFEQFARRNEDPKFGQQRIVFRSVISRADRAEIYLYGSAPTHRHPDGSATTSTAEVIVFVATGHFEAFDAKIPPGKKPPRGSALTAIYQVKDGGTTDWSVGNEASPSLRRLGTVQTRTMRP